MRQREDMPRYAALYRESPIALGVHGKDDVYIWRDGQVFR